MANEEHIELLKKGWKVWNEWRSNHRKLYPDLREASLVDADLSKANLVEADLRRASLSRANLSGADLSGADLRGAALGEAHLSEANLSGADLSEVHLTDTDLRRADLTGAKLTGAKLTGVELIGAKLNGAILSKARLLDVNLIGADLIGADLREADLIKVDLSAADLSEAHLNRASLNDVNLHGARLDRADFGRASFLDTLISNVDISKVKGLDEVVHFTASSIGIDTIYKSKGKIPHKFLIRAGVPKDFIDFMKSLPNKEYYSCFISYSNKDEKFAKRLYSSLIRKGVNCYFAPEDLRGGKKVILQLTDAISSRDKLLLVLSKNSIGSNWVATEIKRAKKQRWDKVHQILFPIRLMAFEDLKKWELFDSDTGTDLAEEVRSYFIPDFSRWKEREYYQKALEQLIRALKRKTRKTRNLR